MEKLITKMREAMEALVSDLDGRTAEVRENFSSFKDVFGKELELQTENFKGYSQRLESRGKKYLNADSLSAEVREKASYAVKDIRTAVDQLFSTVKEGINKVK